MKRTPIAHVVFPRPSLERPVPEVAWDAARVLSESRSLDVELIVPVPTPRTRGLLGLGEEGTWPAELEGALGRLEPRPVVVRYVPIPGRRVESAAAAIAAKLIFRPRAGRPRVVHGSYLHEGGRCATLVAMALDAPSIAVAHGPDIRDCAVNLACGASARRARRALRDATAVVASSRAHAGSIARFGRRAEHIPFTAHPDDFPLEPLPAGRAVLLFEGDGDASDELREAAARRGMELRKAQPGLQTDALAAEYAASACVILSLASEDADRKAVAALLVGRPVILTGSAGAAEIAGGSDSIDAAVLHASDGGVSRQTRAASLSGALDRVLAAKEALSPASLRASALPLTWRYSAPRLEALTLRLAGVAR